MGDFRLKILAEARNILEQEGGSHTEKESLIKLLDILTASAEKISPEDNNRIQNIARELIDHQALLAILKQQTDELERSQPLTQEHDGKDGDLDRHGVVDHARLDRR